MRKLREFYSEPAWLYGHALPARHRLGILRKYGVTRALKLLRISPDALAKVKRTYLDYDSGVRESTLRKR